MSDRRNKSKVKNKTIAWVAAGVVHVVIIGAMLVNFSSEPDVIEGVDAEIIEDTVKAKLIDESKIKDREDEIRKRDAAKARQKKLDEQKLKDLQRDAELEQERIEELKQQKEQELEAANLAEKKRKEVKLKAEQEEIERLKKEAERKKREAVERKRREKLAAEKRLAEEEQRVRRERDELEAKQRLDMLLEEESRMLEEREQVRRNEAAQQQAAQRTTTVMNRYISLIQKAVDDKRRITPDFERWRVAKANIKLSPRGDVLSVRIVNSSGSDKYDRDAETAVRLASPLPIPTPTEDSVAHNRLRDITLNIRMPGAR